MLCSRCGFQYVSRCEWCLRNAHRIFAIPHAIKSVKLALPFDLFDYQKNVVHEVLQALDVGSVNVNAVCGSGKTEMMIPIIQSVLDKGGRVGWATPRVALVHEIVHRFESYTIDGVVGSCWGGHVSHETSALVVFTTHQAYRFYQHFDLVIVDEPDAFPYFKNKHLEYAVKHASKVHLVYLSATAIGDEQGAVVMCHQRPKGSVPVPKIMTGFWQLWRVIQLFMSWRTKRVMIFVPTIRIGDVLSRFLRCPFVSSKTRDLESVLFEFRHHGGWIVTTSILERGVTFENVYVFVLFADHHVFTKEVLVQIAGRVLRGTRSNEGMCVMWARLRSGGLDACKAYHVPFAKSV